MSSLAADALAQALNGRLTRREGGEAPNQMDRFDRRQATIGPLNGT
jgi:hypothetical protein